MLRRCLFGVDSCPVLLSLAVVPKALQHPSQRHVGDFWAGTVVCLTEEPLAMGSLRLPQHHWLIYTCIPSMPEIRW